MAKSLSLIVSTLCLLALAGVAFGNDVNEVFDITGKVYCDTCQIKFETRVSYPIEKAKLKLVCKNATTEKNTLELNDITTDKDGKYTVKVDEDHTDEICDIFVVSSPDPKCNKIVPEIDSARLGLSMESGIISKKRFANPIGFVAEKAIDSCKEVLDELGFVPEDGAAASVSRV